MPYLLLIMEKPGDRESRSEAELRSFYDRMLAFSNDLKARDLLTLSQALKGDAASARVTRQGEKSVVRDGPFTEARELVGGFFLLTCESRDEAIRVARECPATEWATVEVRELGPCFQ